MAQKGYWTLLWSGVGCGKLWVNVALIPCWRSGSFVIFKIIVRGSLVNASHFFPISFQFPKWVCWIVQAMCVVDRFWPELVLFTLLDVLYHPLGFVFCQWVKFYVSSVLCTVYFILFYLGCHRSICTSFA